MDGLCVRTFLGDVASRFKGVFGEWDQRSFWSKGAGGGPEEHHRGGRFWQNHKAVGAFGELNINLEAKPLSC